MKLTVLFITNAALLGLFIFLLRKPGLLTTYLGGRFWLTWLGVGVITLMDELTSVFYAPAEAFRFIGPAAIFFIACMSSAEVGILGGRISGEFQPQMMVLGCFGLSPYAA